MRRINLRSEGAGGGRASRNSLRQRDTHTRAHGERRETCRGDDWQQKDATKARGRGTDGLEGKREKKVKQDGGEGGKGTAKRGAGQREGSPPASQGNQHHHGTAAVFQVALQGKCGIWEKARSQQGGKSATPRVIRDVGRAGQDGEQGCFWLGEGKGEAWKVWRAAGTELCRGKEGMEMPFGDASAFQGLFEVNSQLCGGSPLI